MFIQNLSEREKKLVLVTIILIISAVTYSLIIEPVSLHWKTLGNQIDSKITVFMRNTKLLKMYKTLEEEHREFRDFTEVKKSEEEELAELLGKIENISKKSYCRIVNVKPLTTKSLASYKEIAFEVTAEGSIDSFSRFLYESETSKDYLRIKHFTITSKSEPSDQLKAVFRISKIILI